jgi:hypothetical protein
MEGAVLQGVLIDEAIEMGFQLAGDFGRLLGARTIDETLSALGGKAMHPFPQGRIRQLKRVGDVLDMPFGGLNLTDGKRSHRVRKH